MNMASLQAIGAGLVVGMIVGTCAAQVTLHVDSATITRGTSGQVLSKKCYSIDGKVVRLIHEEDDCRGIGGVWTTTIETPSPAVANGFFTFKPQDDITALELAEALNALLPALACRSSFACEDPRVAIELLPARSKRHFAWHDQ